MTCNAHVVAAAAMQRAAPALKGVAGMSGAARAPPAQRRGGLGHKRVSVGMQRVSPHSLPRNHPRASAASPWLKSTFRTTSGLRQAGREAAVALATAGAVGGRHPLEQRSAADPRPGQVPLQTPADSCPLCLCPEWQACRAAAHRGSPGLPGCLTSPIEPLKIGMMHEYRLKCRVWHKRSMSPCGVSRAPRQRL